MCAQKLSSLCFVLQKTGWGPTFSLAFAAVGVIFGAPGDCLCSIQPTSLSYGLFKAAVPASCAET